MWWKEMDDVTESAMELACCDAVRCEGGDAADTIPVRSEPSVIARAAIAMLALIQRCERRGRAHEVVARHDVGNAWRLK